MRYTLNVRPTHDRREILVLERGRVAGTPVWQAISALLGIVTGLTVPVRLERSVTLIGQKYGAPVGLSRGYSTRVPEEMGDKIWGLLQKTRKAALLRRRVAVMGPFAPDLEPIVLMALRIETDVVDELDRLIGTEPQEKRESQP